MDFQVHPLTAERWNSLETLFGPNGACAGCWCMWYRKSAKQFKADSGGANRLDLQILAKNASIPPGLLGFVDGRPVAWVAIAPRADYPRLAGSRILKPVDDQPVWSITCLFIDKRHRKQGLSTRMIDAAARFAFEHGAVIVEGYPHDLAGGTLPGAFVWTGLMSSYISAGFEEVARNSPKRPIMRRVRTSDSVR